MEELQRGRPEPDIRNCAPEPDIRNCAQIFLGKESITAMTTLVYRYAINPLGSAAARREITEHPLLMEQLLLGHELRNKLVELERLNEEALKALWSEHALVAEAEEAVAEADAAVVALLDRAKQEHSQDRSNKTRPATAKEITAARKALKDARGLRRQRISEVYPLVKPKIEALRKQQRAKVKEIYKDFCTERGLYWATFNQIDKYHKTAVQRVAKARREGKPSQLWFKRWDGQGTISVQLQRQSDDPVRSPQILASDDSGWRNVLKLPPVYTPQEWAEMSRGQRVSAGRGILRWTLGRGRILDLPVQMHRPIPPEGDIAQATLTRTVTGGTAELFVALTVKLPDPEPREGPPVAVHMGWRQRPDGSVRVATWASHKPVTVPMNLTDNVIVHDTGRTGEIVYLAKDIKIAERPAALVSIRDKARAPVQEALAAWVDTEAVTYQMRPDDPDSVLTGAQIQRWRSGRHLARLARGWREQGAPVDAPKELVDQIEAWYRQDVLHLYPWEAHERQQNINYRNNRWREVAAWLTEHVGMVVLDSTDLASMRRKTDPGETDPNVPTEVATAARNRAVVVAPGFLRSAIAAAAARKGVTVGEVVSAGLTRTHYKCGYTAEAHSRFAASIMVVCPGCGDSYDQDHNAARLMLRRAIDGEVTLIHEPGKQDEEQVEQTDPAGV